jgi:hypothetical protein
MNLRRTFSLHGTRLLHQQKGQLGEENYHGLPTTKQIYGPR